MFKASNLFIKNFIFTKKKLKKFIDYLINLQKKIRKKNFNFLF